MKNNKGVTLTSLVIYIVLVTVVMAIVMRITTHFSNNMEDAANVAFETEFNKINLYLLDETKKTGNEIAQITQDGMAVSFSKGNRYVYNYTDKSIYLNDGIKICQNIETCLFEQKTAENGKNILSLTITIDNITKTTEYVCSTKVATQSGKLLPDEYQQVEYIESTGTQYIDTGYYPDENTNAEYKVSISSFRENGPHLLSSKNYYFPLLRNNPIAFVLAKRGSTEFNNTDFRPDTDIIYEIEAYKGDKILINGKEIGVLTSTGGADTTSLYLGTYGGQPNNANYILNGKIYYCKIYNGDELVRDLVPCYHIADNIIGLYDTINDVFYTNKGTGTFEKGPDVAEMINSGILGDYIDENDYIMGEIYNLKIGDYVDYHPNVGVYQVAAGTKGSGYESIQSFTTDELNWRIYSIDELTGTIELISETEAQSSTPLYLQGADGYNHGVDILNELCEKLYSKKANGTKVAIARSIKIEDINEKTNFSPHDYSAYGGIPYTPSSKQYPNVYALELGSTQYGLNTSEKLLKGSESVEKGFVTSQGITEYRNYTGSGTASTLYSTYTYYQYYPEENLKENIGRKTMPLGVIKTDLGYWVASRYAASSDTRVGFGIRRMDENGMVNRDYLFRSTGDTKSAGYAVRPIVTLNATKLIDFETGNGSKEKPWGMNINERDTEEGLPAEYQQVEYIQSSGTQYIDTEVVPSDEIGLYVDFQPLSTGTIFGAITQKSVGYYGINMISSKFEVYWEKSIGKYSSFDYNTRYDVKFNFENSNKFYINTEEICNLPSTDNITNNTIHVFKLNGGTTSYTQYISAKLYGLKVTDGDTLVRNFIPCYRISDNVIGLYDTVNDVFYTNAGTGTFEKGANVE